MSHRNSVPGPNNRRAPYWSPSTAGAIVRAFGIVLALAMVLMTGAFPADARPAEPAISGTAPQTGSTVRVSVHSCPDSLNSADLLAHAYGCVSDTGLFGVPLGMTTGDGQSPSFQYTSQDNGAVLSWEDVAPGMVTISEVVPRIRETEAFCAIITRSQDELEELGEPSAYSMTPVVDGKVQLRLGAGEYISCEWFRFPGGVQIGGGSGEASYSSLTIRTWICSEDDANPSPGALASGFTDDYNPPFTRDPLVDSQTLVDRCSPSDQPVRLTLLSYPDEEVVRDELKSELDSTMVFDMLSPGGYELVAEIEAAVEVDWDRPRLFCESQIPGQESDSYALAELYTDPVDDPAGFLFDIWPQASMFCDVFNIELPNGTSGPYIPDFQPGSSSLMVSVYGCPADMDF